MAHDSQVQSRSSFALRVARRRCAERRGGGVLLVTPGPGESASAAYADIQHATDVLGARVEPTRSDARLTASRLIFHTDV
jgi:hypothetical protein